MATKSQQGSILGVPRGTVDLNISDSIALDEMLSVIEETFKRFGFSPLVTPSMENTDVLAAKAYGEEQDKEIFFMDGKDSALRFDFTVPLARYVAMNRGIPFPFKRYQIGNVWRKDEPQRMRSREFVQADIDIVGSSSASSDAECIAAMLYAIDALHIPNYRLLINSRHVMSSILDHFKIGGDKHGQAMRILDKMAKVSMSEVIKQLESAGVDGDSAQQLISFITEDATNDQKLKKVEINMPETKPFTNEISSVIDMLLKMGVKCEIVVDLSLARGLNYYTGLVWEVVVESPEGRLPSIASGGRYDSLIEIYSKSRVPAVGSSIGVTRLINLLSGKAEKKTYAKAYLAVIGEESLDYAIKIASSLRSSGIYVDMDVSGRSISKQLEHASSIKVKYAVIVGKQEMASGRIKVRDMESRKEELLDIGSAINLLKG